jgi:hypothetical protein
MCARAVNAAGIFYESAGYTIRWVDDESLFGVPISHFNSLKFKKTTSVA